MRANIGTFLSAARWTVSRYMLAKIGSARHEIRFVHPPDGPIRAVRRTEVFDRFSAVHFVERTIDFGMLGILCCSGTTPSIREIVLTATVPKVSPLEFGPNSLLRTGFGERDEFGSGKTYTHRVDFTKNEDRSVEAAELLTLPTGVLRFPLRSAATGVYHRMIDERHRADWFKEEALMSVLSDEERDETSAAFEALPPSIELNVALVLDSEELLLFHWSHEDGHFQDDFFNVGLTTAP